MLKRGLVGMNSSSAGARGTVSASGLLWRKLRCGVLCGLATVTMAMAALAAPPPGYYLVWADEFDGSAFDPKIWSYRNLGPRGDGVMIENAVAVTNGQLVITTYTSNGVHYTGMIGSQGRSSLQYGYLEAAINFDSVSGSWGAFWLQSRSIGSYLGEPDFAGTEIDIAEHRRVYGNDGSNTNIENQIVSNIHWDGYGAEHKRVGSGLIGTNLGAGFHTYGLKWTDSAYEILLDDASWWTTTTAVSKRAEYLILSREVDQTSTIWAGPIPPGGYGSLSVSTNKMFVDYLRYYAPTTTVFWTGATSGDWASAGNWIAGRTPKTHDDIVVSYLTTGTRSMAVGQPFTVRSFSQLETTGPVTLGGAALLSLGEGGMDLASANNNLTVNCRLVLATNQTWRLWENRTLTANAEVGGPGGLTVAGMGTVTLAASNSFTGDTRVQRGTLNVTHTRALAQSTLDLNAADTGTNAFNNLALVLGGLKGSRPLALSSGGFSIGNNHQDTVYSGTLSGGQLIKIGNGVLTLTGTNIYTGGTIISNGTLRVNNTGGSGTGTGTVTVRNGGILTGQGAISGAVTIQSGGVLSPGSAVGTLALNGGLTLNSGALCQLELSGTSSGIHDQLVITGNLTAGSNTISIAAPATLDESSDYLLMSYTGTLTGSFNPAPAWLGAPPSNAAGFRVAAGGGTVRLSYTPPTFTLTYSAGSNGSLSGATLQNVPPGGSGTPVSAIPDAGHYFLNWSDGNASNPRVDRSVTSDITVTAAFAAVPPPQLTATTATPGTTSVNFTGIPGVSYIWQRSSNFSQWLSIATNAAPPGGLMQLKEGLPHNPAFYRVRVP